jgi:hypothetical protein
VRGVNISLLPERGVDLGASGAINISLLWSEGKDLPHIRRNTAMGELMLSIPQLNFGFNDAENYRRNENKELFNQIFVRTDELDRICANNVFFLMGEKGTGKTAYAVYLTNNGLGLLLSI